MRDDLRRRRALRPFAGPKPRRSRRTSKSFRERHYTCSDGRGRGSAVIRWTDAAARRRSKHRDHRSRRPRQDHPGRRDALADRASSAQNESVRRARHGLDRPRAREGHHDHGQEHGHRTTRASHINIVDTPGHADFGGEVERTLNDGGRRAAPGRRRRGPAAPDALRSAEGARGAACRRSSSSTRSTAATRAQPRCSTRSTTSSSTSTRRKTSSTSRCSTPTPGRASATLKLTEPGLSLEPLFEAILSTVPAAASTRRGPPVPRGARSTGTTTSAGSSIGRIFNGAVRQAERGRRRRIGTARSSAPRSPSSTATRGSKRVEIDEARAGRHRRDRAASTRSRSARRSPTPRRPMALPAHPHRRADGLDALLGERSSPLAGARGSFVTSPPAARAPHAGAAQPTSAIRVEETDSPDTFRVSGRGELQLAILIEMMRREGYETQVGKPDDHHAGPIGGQTLEPMEHLVIDMSRGVHRRGHPEDRTAPRRDGQDGEPRHGPRAARVPDSVARPHRLPHRVPHRYARHRAPQSSVRRLDVPWQGDIAHRQTGALVADRAGTRDRLRDRQPPGARRHVHRARPTRSTRA